MENNEEIVAARVQAARAAIAIVGDGDFIVGMEILAASLEKTAEAGGPQASEAAKAV